MDNWHFFLIALLIDGVLIPVGWKLVQALDRIKENNERSAEVLTSLCENIGKLTAQMTDSMVRDIEMKKDLDSVRQELRDHIKEERGK